MQVPTVDPTLITAEPDGRPANTLELWTPRGIGWASVLLGFPGATVLAALNWRRMGRTRKAIVHLVAAVIGTWAIYFVNASVGLLVGLAVGYYLFRAQRSDQSPFATTERSGLAGALIAIAASILIVASGVVIETAAPTGAPRARAYAQSGVDLSNQGQWEKAVEAYTSAIELDPTLALAFINRGTAYNQLGNYDLAVVDLTKAIELDPTDPFAPGLRGIARAQTGDIAGATADFDRALSLTTDPDLTSRIKKLRCDVGLACE